jgi:xylulokinase
MTHSPLLLGIDVGSSGVKVVLLDVATGVVADATSDVEQFTDLPGWSEADPTQWTQAVVRAIPAAIAASGRAASDIAGIAVAGMVPALVLLDEHQRPLRRAILQNDARAVKEIEQVTHELPGFDFVHTTGSALTQQSVAPTMRWIETHEPDVWSRISSVVGSYDWIAHTLGAELHVEWNWALESGMYDLHTHQPIDAVLGVAHVQPEWLPKLAFSGEAVGTVSSDGAAATGLAPGTPIYVGGADHVLSAYGAGLADIGDWLIKLGGAGDILAVTDRPLVDSRLYLDAHPNPERWLPNGCMATSGSVIRWFQAMHGGPSLDELEAEAAASDPAEVLCLPYYLGEKSPLHDPDLRGAFIGLHLGTTRGDLYRSILEGIAYGFRHHVDVFADLGVPLLKARVTNGGSRSRVWKQIIADGMGIELWPVANHPGASLGAAAAAGVGAGLLDDWRSVDRYVSLLEPVVPNAALKSRYDDAYGLFLQATAALTPISHTLARRAAA